MLKSIAKHDNRIADKLGLKDLKMTQQDRFISREEGLKAVLTAANTLLDQATEELKTRRLKVTPELQKDQGLLEKTVADEMKGLEISRSVRLIRMPEEVRNPLKAGLPVRDI